MQRVRTTALLLFHGRGAFQFGYEFNVLRLLFQRKQGNLTGHQEKCHHFAPE